MESHVTTSTKLDMVTPDEVVHITRIKPNALKEVSFWV